MFRISSSLLIVGLLLTLTECSYKPRFTNTLKLLEEQDALTDIPENQRVVLFLGNTKSGVSTTVKILTSNNRLLSTKRNEGSISITDTEGRIGHSPVSKTTVPTFESVNGVHYYDLPSINIKSDRRDIIPNIASSYYVREVLKMANLVKLVLVMDADAVLNENAKETAVKYLVELRKLIKDVELYKSGILLLVNKVDSNLKDAEVVEKIVSSLRKIAEMAKYQDLNEEELSFVSETVTSLLEKTNEEYGRISFLKRPIKLIQKLSDDEEMQRLKRKINSFINQMPFVMKKEYKTGFPLSEKSQIILTNVVEDVSQDIKKTLSVLPSYIREYYNNRIHKITDYATFLRETRSEMEMLKSFAKSVQEITSLEGFILQIHPVLLHFGISQDSMDLAQVSDLIEIIGEFIGNRIELSTQCWMEAVDLMVKESSEVGTWYNFLSQFYDHMSTFAVQTNKDKFDVKYVKEWGKSGKEKGLVVDKTNFKDFLSRIVHYFQGLHPKFESIIDGEANELKIKEINDVLDRTLRSITEVVREGDAIFMFGNIVTLSEANSLIQYLNQQNVITKYTITAAEHLLVDSNLVIDHGRDFSIFSTNWLSDGVPYTIILEGNNSLHYNDTNVDKNGRPGLPGGNSGSFLGLGDKSVNVNLEINTIGGRGGNGENGKDGLNGTDNAEQVSNMSTCNFTSRGHGAYGEHSQTFFFDPVACGGDGGDGGVGGLGGLPGGIKINILTREQTNIITKEVEGVRGYGGWGGKKGLGGASKEYISEHCSPSCVTYNYKYSEFIFPSGKPGRDGVNNVGLQTRQPQVRSRRFEQQIKTTMNYLKRYKHDKYNGSNVSKLYHLLSSIDS